MDNSLASLRIPPHSAEAEAAFLSAIFEHNSVIDDVDGLLVANDFYRHENQLLFARMSAMSVQRRPIDPVTLWSALGDAGEDEDIDPEYVADLATGGRGSHNAKHYAQIIRDRSIDRQLIRKGYEITEIGYSEGDTQEKIDKAQSIVMQASAESPDDIPSINTDLQALVERIDIAFRREGKPSGLYTGYTDLDEKLCGLQPGDLVIIGARPAMGKTALAMNIAENLVMARGDGAIVFELEMSRQQLLNRMASSVGKLPLNLVKSGKLGDDDWPKLVSAVSRLKDSPLFIDDRALTSSEHLISRSRRIQKRAGIRIGLIVVDYLQILKDGGEGVQRIAKISGNLKALAREMECPVVALSQLSRECEKRPNKRPTSADLRDGGSIEADADVVALLYRDEVYHEDSPDRGIAELIITKHRAGETGTVRLASNLHFSRFDNLDIVRSAESAQRYQHQSSQPRRREGFDYATLR